MAPPPEGTTTGAIVGECAVGYSQNCQSGVVDAAANKASGAIVGECAVGHIHRCHLTFRWRLTGRP